MSTIKSTKRDKMKHSATARLKTGGLARKGGGGGKGTWGRAGDEYKYDNDKAYLNSQDPNYDSVDDDEAGFYFSAAPEKSVEIAFAASIYMQKKFKEKIRTAAREFFSSNVKEEFETSIKEAKMRDSLLYHEIVKEVVRMALDKGEKGMHAATELLRHLTKKKIVDPRHIYKGFYHLFNQASEIMIDVPKAKDSLIYALDCTLIMGVSQDQINYLTDSLTMCTEPNTLKKAKSTIAEMAKEYLDSEDVKELSRCFLELKMPYLGHELIKKSISIAMDRGPRERELVSKLVSETAGSCVTREESCKGFEILLQRVEDLHMDVPDVLEILAAFVARAVADEAIPPSFLLQAHIQEGDGGYAVIQHAQRLLSKPHAMSRLQRVWGPNSGDSILSLKKTIKDLVLEYFSSADLKEAAALCKGIPPHFHHEIVKRSFVLALDKNQREVDLTIKLLLDLYAKRLTWKSQLAAGLRRIEVSLDDMVLDNTKAKDIYAEFREKVVKDAGIETLATVNEEQNKTAESKNNA